LGLGVGEEGGEGVGLGKTFVSEDFPGGFGGRRDGVIGDVFGFEVLAEGVEEGGLPGTGFTFEEEYPVPGPEEEVEGIPLFFVERFVKKDEVAGGGIFAFLGADEL